MPRFELVPEKDQPSDLAQWPSSSTGAKLKQWNIADISTVTRVHFEGKMGDSSEGEREFLLALINSEPIRSIMLDPSPKKARTEELSKIDNIDYSAMSASVTSMTFFDKIAEAGMIAEPHGHIKQCMEEEFNGTMTGNVLRDMLLNEESPYNGVFSDADKQEFLYAIFRQLVLGGAMCQPEDTFDPYLRAVKDIYRDLIDVHKTMDKKEVQVSSKVFRIRNVDSVELFDHPNNPINAFYVVTNPKTHIATCWLVRWKPFW